MNYFKYPRTMHLPWSPGATNDDKILQDLSIFNGKNIIITEKMDGENTTLYSDKIHARSIDSNDHPSRSWVKSLWGSIKHEIPTGWRLCGENLYAKHSISYETLPTYFMVFSVWNDANECLSWKDTVDICNMLNLQTVPVQAEMTFDETVLRKWQYALDEEKQEGFVIRNSESFHFNDFSKNVAKWVRKEHVQTDEHWMYQKVVPNKLM